MNKIVTISREFGSGGRELGKRLADKLGFFYYDREIITEISKKVGLSEEYIKSMSENGKNQYPFQFAKSFTVYSAKQNNQTEILIAQQKVLKEIAKKGNSVIVGRGANVILKEYNPINIFVYADIEAKIKRCEEREKGENSLTKKEIENQIKQIDKSRKSFHNIISNIEWGEKENYDLCINTTNVEIKDIIPAITQYIQNYFREE